MSSLCDMCLSGGVPLTLTPQVSREQPPSSSFPFLLTCFQSSQCRGLRLQCGRFPRISRLRSSAVSSVSVSVSPLQEKFRAVSKESQRGRRRESKAQVFELIEQLRAKGRDNRGSVSPPLSLLQGRWRMLWTDDAELLSLLETPLFGTASDVLQDIDLPSGRLDNVIDYAEQRSFFNAETQISPQEGRRRVDFGFKGAKAVVRGLGPLSFPVPVSGWFDILYVDPRLRVTTDSRGSTLVFEKADDARTSREEISNALNLKDEQSDSATPQKKRGLSFWSSRLRLLLGGGKEESQKMGGGLQRRPEREEVLECVRMLSVLSEGLECRQEFVEGQWRVVWTSGTLAWEKNLRRLRRLFPFRPQPSDSEGPPPQGVQSFDLKEGRARAGAELLTRGGASLLVDGSLSILPSAGCTTEVVAEGGERADGAGETRLERQTRSKGSGGMIESSQESLKLSNRKLFFPLSLLVEVETFRLAFSGEALLVPASVEIPASIRGFSVTLPIRQKGIAVLLHADANLRIVKNQQGGVAVQERT
uniref:Plastid lipid-associated protein/fibrillin conserved domain-containing protein n=1 Tax=Chromera velia CCMP2878 TaxID=1169474 RepID=A0A0G4FYL8_9ALVE|eukprot:Cvel_3882.t1-p1 / transcript=Cvel_3882.t1 / gene=Cvel_3882 / organism=Chromera_velia_CCMP2878 / gene_product=Probable plastid-lipid-associated protein 11,, putative / transcript_product=Probable plastid-lipid-associated protein 11,, putative / location=Cvel_scaffold164:59986-62724(+) / protein_length=531 / sequence_SO=supercontig / SO=protein_coding / is_pseudo=false